MYILDAKNYFNIFLFNFIMLNFYYAFFLLNYFFELNMGYLLFDFFFIFFMVSFILYSCYLLFFFNFKKNEIAINLNLCLTLMLTSLFLVYFVHGIFYNFFFVEKYFYFNNYFCMDCMSYIMKFWILFFSLMSNIMFEPFLLNNKKNVIEVPILLLFTSYLLSILLNIVDFFAILMILESLSFLMMSFSMLLFTKQSGEAMIKYFVQNTVMTGFSVFGIFWLYFMFKNTNLYILSVALDHLVTHYSMVPYDKVFMTFAVLLWLVSFFFKLGIFPFHFYVPDMYCVASIPSMFIISSLMKPIIFFMLFKIYFVILSTNVYFLNFIFLIFGLLSMLVGNILAMNVTNMKSFIGCTSMSQFGFLIMCLSSLSMDMVCLSFMYLFIYNLFLFFMLAIFMEVSPFLEESNMNNLTDLSFALKDKLFLKVLMSMSLLMMSGLPPMFIFFLKYLMFLNLFFASSWLIVLMMILLNVISAFYYLKMMVNLWLIDIYGDETKYLKKDYYALSSEYSATNLNFLMKLNCMFTVALFIILLKFFDPFYSKVVLLFMDAVI